MTDVVEKMRAISRYLLEEGKVDVVIGFKTGTLPGRPTPCFITEKEDCGNLIWEEGCQNNLANYLREEKRQAAVIVKGCDSRSLINLLTENQLSRERIFIIGAPCPVREKCPGCQTTAPLIFDHLIDSASEDRAENDFRDVHDFARLPAQERKAYIYQEVSKCIRCYACRNACPACYCPECFVESNLPPWVGKSTDIADNVIFHLTRALHLAGRCVDCGACQRACPMGVDLRLLNHKVMMDVKNFYQFEAGLAETQEPPLNTGTVNDPEPFRVRGEKHAL
ncbi:4Fe-4S dicluster domain-containing protein [Candidatus Formimonas warabiya]|uniref:4Fe-4S ferredoxin-type domain-containing protein n=1 Tax=Formimonas warabiya TaxID=1761012 RepID=A0A3G1KYQ9_FORW1|nr:4Fe-4S dicluster domain-containing protein [Candidatus Formimonas warabiya]ATW27517.1 hypothetical protein DCMF_24650 [Candidatus Formimonas warabiya]